jgi:hypothetical protein
MQTRDWLFIAVLLWGGWHALAGALPFTIPSIVAPATKVSAVVYVYEKDDSAIPSPVAAALNTLNRQGIVATTFEDDTVDGTGEVPAQYAIPLAEARKAGMPLLVVMSGSDVVRVVKAPTTDTQVLEAAR